jgi:hypothetical protein
MLPFETTTRRPPALPSSLYETNRNAYLSYVDEHLRLVRTINEDIRLRSDVFLFGAHAQAQYLIGFGLNTDTVQAVLDNDKNKHGKRLYGTDKTVFGPQILADKNEPTVIVRAGTFTREIVEQIRAINPSTRFLL